MDFIKNFTVEKQPDSQVKITGEVPFAELEKDRGKAIASLGKNLKVDGFRPGHIPDKVIIERVGEMAILSEMAERTLARVYPAAVKELSIDAIGYPSITITKIALGNPLGFTATVTVIPEMTLPDYRSVAKTVNATRDPEEVTDADVEKAIEDIQRQQAAYARLQERAAHQHQHDHVHEEGDEHHHDHEHEHEHHHHDHEGAGDEAEEALKAPLPPLTDEYVKKLGKFESVEDFKTTIREHLKKEKERDVRAAHRAKLTDSIIETTELDLPKLLVDSELEQMFGQMQEELTRANLRMDDYLGHINKTKEDLFKDWTPAAEKRAKLQLVLNEIAKIEKIEANTDAVDEQVGSLMERYPDADRERVRIYVESLLKNEAVMKLLEEA